MANINGTSGDDTFGAALNGTSGNDTISALAGNDWIFGSTGNDRIDGGSGNSDVVMYSSLGSGVFVNNTGSQVGNVGAFRVLKSGGQQDTLIGIEAIHGSQFSDKIYMGNNTYVFAEGGNDDIHVGTSVLVFAGSGNDTIYGGTGSWLDYNAGDAVLQTRGIVAIWNTATSGIVTDDGWGNTDKFFGMGRISGSAFSDVITGNIGNDQMSGVAGDDYLYGNGGADSIDGGDGNDMLFGGAGDDEISGGDGDDSIYGGDGNNSLNGGDGNDVYFVQSDVAANDRIDDAGGDADILQVLDTAGRDAYRLVYDGNTLVHETAQGHRTEIALDENGAPVIEYLQWMGSDEYGTDNYTNTLRIVTDLSNISGRLIAVAGTDWADTIVMPNETPQDGEYWGEIYANGGDDNITLSSTIQYITYAGEGDDRVFGIGDIGDYVDGDAGNDSLDGQNGDDTIFGGAGDDYLYGGNGNDSLIGNDGNNRFYGGAGSDTIIGGVGDNVIEYIDDRSFGHAGTHGLIANLSSNSITVNIGQGAGSQTVASGNVLDGFGGTDVVSGINEIQATAFADYVRSSDDGTNIWGHAGNDTLIGGAANDFITGGSGADILNGAGGNWNILAYNSDTEWSEPAISHGVIVNLSAYGISANLGDGSGVRNINASTALDGWNSVDQVSNFQTVLLSDLNDYAVAGASSIYMSGNAGDDTMIGGSGNDSIVGDDGNDSLFGGDGVNRFYGGAGSDTIIGSLGYDIIEYIDDRSFGHAGTHGLIANLSSNSITVNIGQGAGSQTVASGNVLDGFGGTDVVSGINEIQATAFADYVRSSDDGTNIWGHAGNDTLIGGATNDFITGGSGNDVLDGAGGNWNILAYNSETEWNEPTVLHGVILNLSAYSVYADLGDGRGTRTVNSSTAIDGWDSVDQVTRLQSVLLSDLNDYAVAGTSSVYISGNDGDDTIIGGTTSDTLLGDNGNDSLVGGIGDDSIVGGFGDDKLFGGDGNDTIDDGVGFDTIDGGAGVDTFVRFYEGVDYSTVLGFDLSRGLAYAPSAPNTAAEVFIDIENLHVSGGYTFNLTGNSADNILETAAGNDSLYGGAGNDSLIGGAGNDLLNAGSGQNLIDGGDGNDVFVFRYEGNTIVNDAAGSNLLRVERQSGVYFSTLYYNDQGGLVLEGTNGSSITISNSANLSGIQWVPVGPEDGYSEYTISLQNLVVGTLGGDLLTSPTTSYVEVYAADGNDQITVLSNSSWVSGDGGSDIIYGGQGGDVIHGDFRALNTGSDTMFGGDGNDMLWGEAGQDVLDGGAGNDTMIGGVGNDTYVVNAAGDVVTENASEGTDLVQSSISYVLGSNVENLTLSGSAAINATGNTLNNAITGNSGANSLIGLNGNDTLIGGAGNDTLDGGTDNDSMTGGAGDDTYVVDSSNDVVVELATSGTDLVQSSAASYTLTADVENLTLTGSSAINGTGNVGNNILTGNSAANSISGGGGNDTIIGGAGNDTLEGAAGNDSLTGGDGVDTASYNGSAAAVTVNLTITSAQNTVGAGTDTLATIENLIGSAYNDVLTGDASANSFSGGFGNDSLTGGAGNDTLDGGAGNDVLTGGDGTDTASYASATAGVTVSLALATAQNTVGAGTDTLTTLENLTGSAFNDVLTGSTTANRIDGGAGNDLITGGAGVDTLNGGDGSDIYMLTVLTDKTAAEIADTGANGTDELRFAATAAGTLTLAAGDTGLERVVIGTGTAAAAVATATTALNIDAAAATKGLSLIGNAGINTLTGTAFNDSIDGGAGNDILIGGVGNDTLYGGLGNDALTGGSGSDVFVFNTAPNASSNKDSITDFVSANDDIWLAKSVMTGLGATTGALSVDAFWSGAGVATSHDATDRIVYNSTTGALYYDADGNGSTAAVQIAQLTAGTALTYQDFLII